MKKAYFYAGAQILAQREHTSLAVYDQYFYVHDRLGSVRMVVKYNGTDAVNTVHSYGYTPFGDFYAADTYETAAEADNPFKFTGQWYDAEIDQYYLRARMYDPAMMRFTSRDPVRGRRQEPLTLHKYLYTANDPINAVDPAGEAALNIANGLKVATTIYSVGLTVAVTGAEYGNLSLILAGGMMQQMSGLGFAIGMGGICFAEGTEISTPIGNIPIEQIQVGWYVWASDSETGKPSLFKVVECFERETDELIVITVDGDQIETTYEHPFYVYEYGWQRAGELKIGTDLVGIDGNPVRITNIEIVSGNRKVYNFEVADSHTYYVSNANLLVHNFCGRTDKFQRTANNLAEKLAMEQAMSNPGAGLAIKSWPGFTKYAMHHNGIEIHYVKSIMTGIFGDFKFILGF
ncbi:MAG: hypothetical protein H8E17_18410 [Deltaproteobacteria bacterium]|nr:hypothetical protein [Deltaproteobacteria bacterium]